MKDSLRQKRNKPCENCRTHRRKCVNFDHSKCERCRKHGLDCVYKMTEKPIKLYKPIISSAKLNKLFDAVWLLQEQAEVIQLQISQLKNSAATVAESQCVEPSHCQDLKLLPKQSSSQWELTISGNNRGIRLQTSVRSMSDLLSFLKEAFSAFIHDSFELGRKFSETGARQSLTVTHKVMKYEYMFYNLFSHRTQKQPPEPRPSMLSTVSLLIDDNKPELLSKQMRFIKLQMIKTYFNCHALFNPIFIYGYHYPLLTRDPDSLLSTAMAAMVAYSPCVHINLEGFPFTRAQLAEACRLQAKEMLQDMLFESEPCIELCLALWLVCFSSLHGLKSAEARFQASICWRMIIQLKSTYASTNHQLATIEESIKAEVWRRLFYIVRFLEFNMRMLYDGARDFSNFVHHLEVGLPTPLPCELLDDQLTRAVLCFQYVSRLTINSAGIGENNEIEIAGLGLLAGHIDSIPSNALLYFERYLLHMWDNIPESLRLGFGPYRLIDPTSVETCRDPCILRFNAIFYIYSMSLQSRLMQTPHTTDLTAATFGKIDGDRSLIIASICSDAATKIFKVLCAILPCGIELHWITMCVGVLKLLATATNEPVRVRAKENHTVLSQVLMEKLNGIGDHATYVYASQAPYLSQVKNLITLFMGVD